ncbi:MAG: DUF167 domain-containing protein [Planctomycetota bacterium]|jgi:uncharacterized protein (TIGR00251 family)|nr:DUF167 domain-containing protein [Planctomycetota bacterium]
MGALSLRNGEVFLSVKVVPGSSHVRMVLMGDRLKVSVVSPPEKGKANKEMVKIVREWFGGSVRLHSGDSSPYKVVALSEPLEIVQARLEAL